ncbi:MAG: hypothetical protein BWX47_01862 [candidate division Hyd24-12 bacterium ADurb.Bin004]|nr:MAG: hypothetical protein BWX47_01862 [candidate division Hyd24-12 bacterium ADurb.Bin004]
MGTRRRQPPRPFHAPVFRPELLLAHLGRRARHPDADDKRGAHRRPGRSAPLPRQTPFRARHHKEARPGSGRLDMGRRPRHRYAVVLPRIRHPRSLRRQRDRQSLSGVRQRGRPRDEGPGERPDRRRHRLERSRSLRSRGPDILPAPGRQQTRHRDRSRIRVRRHLHRLVRGLPQDEARPLEFRPDPCSHGVAPGGREGPARLGWRPRRGDGLRCRRRHPCRSARRLERRLPRGRVPFGMGLEGALGRAGRRGHGARLGGIRRTRRSGHLPGRCGQALHLSGGFRGRRVVPVRTRIVQRGGLPYGHLRRIQRGRP